MIGIEVKDGRYVITLPKLILVLEKADFVKALRQGKALKHRQALAERLTQAAAQRRRQP